jgi:hypothetical protein
MARFWPAGRLVDVSAGFAAVRTIAAGSQGIFIGRAKTIMGFGCYDFLQPGVYSSRKIAIGFLDIHDSRAKVITGTVMVYGSRKIVMGYAGMRGGWSVGHYGLLT